MIWLPLLILLVCSAVVSASETALFGVDRTALRAFAADARRSHRRVHRLMRQPARVLMTVLIANTAINVALFAGAFVAARTFRETRPFAAALVGVGVLFAVLVFGEIVPKTVVLASPSRFAPWAAGIIATLGIILAPLRWILRNLVVDPLIRLFAPPPSLDGGPVTTGELQALVEESAREGVIDSRENDMLQAIVAVGDVSVREMMTPRVDMPSVRLDAPRHAARKAVREASGRRVVVYGRDPDDVRGVLHARDLYLHPRESIHALLKPVRFVPEQVHLVQLLRFFRKTQSQLAVVVDEYGGTAGLVTVSDVIRWIAGAAVDTGEVRAAIEAERIDEDTYRLPGRLSVRAWADRFAVRSIDRRIATVGGLVLAMLGRMPHVGDVVHISNLRLTVTEMRHRRIETIILRRESASAPLPEGSA